jgi:NTP pyrophosphatase (non-canonical NTP hydrolase)
MSEHFNELRPEQLEALALVAEECGEVIQVIGKILRHGLYSCHPNGGRDNQALLEDELGDLHAALHLAEGVGLFHAAHVRTACADKLQRVERYLHHIAMPERAP